MLFIYFCHNVLSVMRGSDRPHIEPGATSAGRLTPSRYHNTDLSLILNTGSLVTLGPVRVIWYLSSQPRSQQGYHSSSDWSLVSQSCLLM